MAFALCLKDVDVVYSAGLRHETALSGVSLSVDTGEFVGVYGRRGSGRSTLLHVAAGIVVPTRGRIEVAGMCQDRGGASRAVLCQVPTASEGAVGDHLALSLLAANVSYRDARQQACALLGRTGAADCVGSDLHDLDREQLIRVALARALGAAPRVILFDEPTLGLNFTSRERILLLLRHVARSTDVAVVVTAGEIASMAGVDRALHLASGRLHGEIGPRAAVVHRMRNAATGGSA